MLNKLIKYDLKWLNKVMIIYYIIFIALAIITKFVETLEMSTIVVIIDKILSGTFIACGINIIINSILRLWIRFNLNLYKDESYLAHTLPISKAKLFDSKILSGIISVGFSILVLIIGILIVYLNKDTIDAVKILLENINNTLGNSTLSIISLVLIVLLELIYMMNIGIFALTLGNRFNNGKILKSIIIGLATYGLSSLLILGIIYIIGLFNPTIMTLFQNNMPSASALKEIIYFSLAIYTIFNTVVYLISKTIFKKGVNVE